MSEAVTEVTEAEWRLERERSKRVSQVSATVGLACVAGLALPATVLAQQTASGVWRYPAVVAWLLVLLVPVMLILVRANRRQTDRSDQVVETLTHQLVGAVEAAGQEASRREAHAVRQKFESRLANALDMAEGEPEVIDVIERSFVTTVPDTPVELLLADNSHAHLLRMAAASPTDEVPGCSVGSPDHCPAARRAQVQRFPDSGDLDACPKLRGRPAGAVSALCVPVAIMGRTVGVIHATAAAGTVFAEETEADLGTLAKLAGARIGLLRVMADTELQASTDSLTGLANRRSFEQKVAATRGGGRALSVAMVDLDHFKTLNDTHGHETGDRALRLFAQVLRNGIRAEDLLCRHGGEEFVVAFPGGTAANARAALEAVRTHLDAAVTVAGLPGFTASFGVVDAGEHENLPAVISRADAALFEAKRGGRDRVVVHDRVGRTVGPAPSSERLVDLDR